MREVARLHVVAARRDGEAAVAPLVPDGRQQHRPVAAVGREHRQERLLQEIAEAGDAEVLAHLRIVGAAVAG